MSPWTRNNATIILKDLNDKIVLLSGPRQAGKTTLGRSLSDSHEYLNFDSVKDRLRIMEGSWDRSRSLIVFDELHKMRGWKSWIKGVYDTEGIPPAMLVTGSARLDIARRMGDSLAGRFFMHRLFPLDNKELREYGTPDHVMWQLLEFGGFPEPFFKKSKQFYSRWKTSHTDIIIRQDLISLENIRDISSIEVLIELLRERVGSPVSYASLARDLERDAKTIRRWLQSLENMYVIFSVRPYHRNIARSLLKEPKFYFFDIAQVKGDGQRLENLVALSLLKEITLLKDSEGTAINLNYLRNKDHLETDFCITGGKKRLLIEVKKSEDMPSPGLKFFHRKLSGFRAIQLVAEIDREKTYPDGIEIRRAANWLTHLNFS